MKFICDQQILASVLSTVGRATSKRTTLPITQGIRMIAQNGAVTFTGTNLDLTIEQKVIANVEETGETVVMGNLFTEIVKKLPPEPIKVTLNDDRVTVETAGANFSLVAFGADDFPEVKTAENPTNIKIGREAFVSMIKQTLFAVSGDESKGALTGIRVEIGNGEIKTVGIDGFRLALRTEPIDTNDSLNFIVPSEAMGEVARISSESPEIGISLGENLAKFTIGDAAVYTRLMAGDYPEWEKLLPKNQSLKVVVDTEELKQSVDRASIFAESGRNNLAVFDINEKISITSKSEEGNVSESVEADINGEPVKVGFNVRYVLDALRVIDDEKIKLSLIDGLKPGIITPVDGERFTYMILPVRII